MAPTAEEAVTEFVRGRITSYKNLPVILYQIGEKYRNENPNTEKSADRYDWKRSDYSSHTNRLISDTGTHQRQKERNYPGRI